MEPQAKRQLEGMLKEMTEQIVKQPISMSSTLKVITRLYRAAGRHTPAIFDYFKLMLESKPEQGPPNARMQVMISHAMLECEHFVSYEGR